MGNSGWMMQPRTMKGQPAARTLEMRSEERALVRQPAARALAAQPGAWTMAGRLAALVLTVLVLSASGLLGRTVAAQRELAGKLIRLHVVASSDSRKDQWRKLRVRDALLSEIEAMTADCPDAEAAAQALEAGLPALEAVALRALGTGEPVRARLGVEAFPRRDYPTFSLPAGPYRALRVTLGAGEGHNWWCVAFPALCLPASTEEGTWFWQAVRTWGFTETELELMTGEAGNVEFRFRLLDWLFGE